MDKINNPYHDNKLFWPYHTEKALTLLSGELPSPSLIEIDPTDGACNQSCIHCCFDSGPHRKMVQINVKMLLRFLAEAYENGTYAYELVGGGEPLNHSKIADIIIGIDSISKLSQERTHIGLVTNGVLLERIFPVASCIDFIRISLDAPNAIIYNPLHGISLKSEHFQKVIENIKKLVDITSGEHVRIGYLVVPPYNNQRDTILETASLAYNLGVKHIAFRPALLPYATNLETWSEAINAILEAKSMYHEGFVLGGRSGSWEHALGNYEHPEGMCRMRPLVLTIKASGIIPSCFLYRERLVERPAIGHISQGFKNVWFSEWHKRSLQSVNRSNCPEFCKLYRTERAFEQLEKIVLSSGTIPVLEDKELDNPHFI